jgi:hypothetical protein
MASALLTTASKDGAQHLAAVRERRLPVGLLRHARPGDGGLHGARVVHRQLGEALARDGALALDDRGVHVVGRGGMRAMVLGCVVGIFAVLYQLVDAA